MLGGAGGVDRLLYESMGERSLYIHLLDKAGFWVRSSSVMFVASARDRYAQDHIGR